MALAERGKPLNLTGPRRETMGEYRKECCPFSSFSSFSFLVSWLLPSLSLSHCYDELPSDCEHRRDASFGKPLPLRDTGSGDPTLPGLLQERQHPPHHTRYGLQDHRKISLSPIHAHMGWCMSINTSHSHSNGQTRKQWRSWGQLGGLALIKDMGIPSLSLRALAVAKLI